MADTQRTVSAIYTLLADNAVGAISAQDLRDGLETMRCGYGQLYVAADSEITPSNTTDYTECTAGTWTLGADAHWFDESGGNGRLTYTGAAAVVCLCIAAFSMTAGGNNQVSHWKLGKSGTTAAASEIDRKIGTGTDVGSASTMLLTSLANGNYLSLWGRNETSTATLTVTGGSLSVITFPA